jgi:hypothetical protein
MPNTTVKTTLITVIGSIVVALLTTVATIWSNTGEIRENKTKLEQNKNKLDTLNLQASAFKLPVGTVVASMLKPSEFAKEVGDPDTFDLKNSKWTLADGKSVSGTRWAALRSDAAVPNLCGVFLRGKNNGKRTDVKEFELSEFAPDTVGPHEHNVRFYDPGAPESRLGASIWWDGGKRFTVGVNEAFVEGIASNEGLPETRPKNVTVNYFIKIND